MGYDRPVRLRTLTLVVSQAIIIRSMISSRLCTIYRLCPVKEGLSVMLISVVVIFCGCQLSTGVFQGPVREHSRGASSRASESGPRPDISMRSSRNIYSIFPSFCWRDCPTQRQQLVYVSDGKMHAIKSGEHRKWSTAECKNPVARRSLKLVALLLVIPSTPFVLLHLSRFSTLYQNHPSTRLVSPI